MTVRFNMRKIFHPLLFWTLILCACSTSLSPTDGGPLVPVSPPPATTESIPDSPALPIPKLTSTLQTPHIDQQPNKNESTITPDNESCGYQWAYKDLPELSNNFLQAVQQLQPSAQANAFAFGEDCIHADGHADFIAMETDFNITLQITDLTDANECGEWVVQIMQVITNIPRKKLLVRDPDE